ncbi:MAG: nucleotidyltransferase domain-containing protein [Planctomycetes bacterium]|nr:nucleotidyltransferase domain-containing protein [Planctomycetota bacterium]
MTDEADPGAMKDVLALRERAKELRCLYAIDTAISDRGQAPSRAFLRVLQEIPAGWQRPDSAGARIVYLGRNYVGPGFASDGQMISEPIRIWGTDVGTIAVSERLEIEPPFVLEEVELLRRIARRLGEYLEWKHTELLGERTSPTSAHWAWRQRFAEALADSMDVERFGVSRVYLGGSTARGDARSGSDIDLYIRCHGSEQQREELAVWIEGWSICLAQVALQQTGESFPGGILNVQWLEGEPGIWQRGELVELSLRRPPSIE